MTQERTDEDVVREAIHMGYDLEDRFILEGLAALDRLLARNAELERSLAEYERAREGGYFGFVDSLKADLRAAEERNGKLRGALERIAVQPSPWGSDNPVALVARAALAAEPEGAE